MCDDTPLAERVQAALTDEVLRDAFWAYEEADRADGAAAAMRAVLLAALAPTTPQE